MEHNLYFNIVPFRWSSKPKTMYFHPNADLYEGFKLHKTLFPKEIKSVLKNITSETEYIACSYGYPKEDFVALEIDFQNDNQDLIKRYYIRQIAYYFKKINPQIHHFNFINGLDVWLLTDQESSKQFDIYDKFSLAINIAEITKNPELLISYEGQSKVYKESVETLKNKIEPRLFTKVLYENKLFTYEKVQQFPDRDLNKIFPVLNNEIRQQYNIFTRTNPLENKYNKYEKAVSYFYETFLNNDDFKKYIPLFDEGFLKVPEYKIARTSYGCNQLSFGKIDINQRGKHTVTHQGLAEFGPFSSATQKNIQIFIIFHESEFEKAKFLTQYFQKEISLKNEVYGKMQISMHIKEKFSIKFKDRKNPLPEINDALTNRIFDTDNINYFAIYISPINKFTNDQIQKEVYYKIKERLLKKNIASQVIDSAHQLKKDTPYLVYTLNNIAVAALAKLGGIPWRLETELKEELVIGVGAFKQISTNTNYIASAFCYQNNGNFQGFEYFREKQTKQLAGSIIKAIKDFRMVHPNLTRLIIHFYKLMNQKELEPIQLALEELKLEIPVFIVTINKTASSDIVIFDRDWAELMPLSGTYVNVNKNTFLLCNNTRYSGEVHNRGDGFPFPIKLKFACTDEEELQNPTTIKELIEQVYQFSRLYYKSVRQQNLPVTIKYPEMVAQIAPHFENDDIPENVKKQLWFL